MSVNDEKNHQAQEASTFFGPEIKAWLHTLPASAIFDGKPTVSPPTGDPCSKDPSGYPPVPGITCNYFYLPPEGLTPEQRQQALSQLQKYESKQKAHFLGYQANQKLDYEDDLKQYLNFHINNIGDPFTSGNFTLNSKWMERAVLDYYASLWNARWPHNPKDRESYWGYVLTMGSTEGNLYGLWNARDYLAGKFLLEDPTAVEEAKRASIDGSPRSVQRRLVYQQAPTPEDKPNTYTPIAFYSEDTHYSIIKAMRVLSIQTFYEIGKTRYPNENPLNPGEKWPQEVPSSHGGDGPGSMDIPSLVKLVTFFASKGYPILVCFNYGTTFKGAYDDVEAAGEALVPIIERYGLYERKVYYDPSDPKKYDIRNGFWFHVDGALGAAYMPFVEMAYKAGKLPRRGPNFDFREGLFVHSLVMSGHKWMGAPWPCGIYMTRTKLQLRPPDNPAYLGSPDTTFAGSRNGLSAMIFWDYLAKNSYNVQINKAVYTENLASYAYQQLIKLEKRIGKELWIGRTSLSLTIRFKRPNNNIVFKYSLSNETLCVDGQEHEYSHIFMMEHVTPALIDELIQDLSQPDAFPEQSLAIDGVKLEGEVEPHVSHEAETLIYVPHTGRGFK